MPLRRLRRILRMAAGASCRVPRPLSQAQGRMTARLLAPLHYFLRFYVLRPAAFILFLAASTALAQSSSSSQSSSQPPATVPAPSAASSTLPQPVADAEAAIVKSDWNSAQTALAPYLAAHPSDARALFDSGYIADAQNHLDQAEAFYRKAIAADPRSFEAHLSLGLLLARQGKLEQARPEFVAATAADASQADPQLQARAWRALARIDRKSDPTAASNDLLQALKLTPETSADTLLAADLADQSGQFDAAADAYRRILATNPSSTDANFGLAHVLVEQKKYPDAETVLRAALQQLPGDPALTAQLATVLVAENKAEALPLLEKLYAAHPADPNITEMLAQVRAEAGDAAGSDQLCLKLLAASPDDTSLLDAHGENLLHLRKFAEAYAAFSKAVEVDPANGDGWSGLAFAASRTGKPDVTLHALTMRSQLLPETPFTYFLWATSYDFLHQNAQAIVYYHHFLDAAAGNFPDEETQARKRLQFLQTQK